MPINDRRPQSVVKNIEETEVKENAEILPEQEEKEEVKSDAVGTETPSTPSREEEPSTQNKEDIKPVEPNEETGYSDKITALKQQEELLRKQIVDLRKERRTVKEEPKEDLFLDKTKEDDSLDDILPEDIAKIEKVLKNKGYVRKDEIKQESYREKADNAKDEWLNAHPEYLPENDPDDKNWTILKGTIDTYFKSPKNPAEIKKVMDLAHTMVKGSLPPVLPIKEKSTINANQERLKVSSKMGSGGAIATSPRTQPTGKKIDTSFLKGFTDEEINEMNS